MLHQTPKNCGALGHGKRSPQKKAAVTTFKGARLLKWLVAYCVLHSVSATSETMPTCGCAVEIAALQKDNDAKIDALEVAHAAKNEAIHQKFDQKLQAVYVHVGMAPPSTPPSPPPSTPPSPPPPYVSPNTDWVVMCGTNAGSQLKLVNGVDVGTAAGGTGGVSLFVNGGPYNQYSDFAIAEVVVWPRGLTSAEMHRASDHLMDRMG